MLKKTHILFTLLFTGITTLIMVIMSLCYLYVSEQGQYQNETLSFENKVTNLLSSLELQQPITYQWLAQLEAINHYMISLTDNGLPFLYNQLKLSGSQEGREELMEEAITAYEKTESDTRRSEFLFYSPSTQGDYFGYVADVSRDAGTLQVTIVSPLQSFHAQIFHQRIFFLLVNLITFLFLSVFSWFFTKRLLKPIEESQKRQTEFVASASHELRTPIAAIVSCAESCQNAPPVERNTFLKSIRFEALRMNGLIEDMLTLSQSDQYRFSIQKNRIDLDTLLLNFCESFEPMAAAKQISLTVTLPEASLPPCHCDKNRIGQVIAVLLHNAVSYTPDNGKIHLLLTKNKYCFLISVSDNGPGIPAVEKDKIFERFYRSESSRSTKGHYGLGLCIAAEIVKAHSGSIKVTDTAGGGSTFTVSLPE